MQEEEHGGHCGTHAQHVWSRDGPEVLMTSPPGDFLPLHSNHKFSPHNNNIHGPHDFGFTPATHPTVHQYSASVLANHNGGALTNQNTAALYGQYNHQDTATPVLPGYQVGAGAVAMDMSGGSGSSGNGVAVVDGTCGTRWTGPQVHISPHENTYHHPR